MGGIEFQKFDTDPQEAYIRPTENGLISRTFSGGKLDESNEPYKGELWEAVIYAILNEGYNGKVDARCRYKFMEFDIVAKSEIEIVLIEAKNSDPSTRHAQRFVMHTFLYMDDIEDNLNTNAYLMYCGDPDSRGARLSRRELNFAQRKYSKADPRINFHWADAWALREFYYGNDQCDLEQKLLDYSNTKVPDRTLKGARYAKSLEQRVRNGDILAKARSALINATSPLANQEWYEGYLNPEIEDARQWIKYKIRTEYQKIMDIVNEIRKVEDNYTSTMINRLEYKKKILQDEEDHEKRKTMLKNSRIYQKYSEIMDQSYKKMKELRSQRSLMYRDFANICHQLGVATYEDYLQCFMMDVQRDSNGDYLASRVMRRPLRMYTLYRNPKRTA